MPSISIKGKKMPQSPIRKLVPSADIAKEKGNKVYFLNIGQPDISSPKSAIQALKNWDENILAYTRSEGTVEYKNALCNYYHKKGFTNLTSNHFITTTGGSEALIFTLSLIANPEDEIIIPEPFYANYNGFSIQAGINIVPVTSHIEDGFKLPPIESFKNKITDKTKAILICHPGNPTGYFYTKEELEQLKDLVLEHDLYLISDEVYREFTYDKEYISVLSFPELENNAIVIDSESKRFSMCGIRLGAIISKNQAVLDTALKFAQARLSPVMMSQEIAVKAHENSEKYLEEARNEYKKRRDFIVPALNQIEGVVCPKPDGAFYCIVKLPVDSAEKFARWMLEEFDYNGETVMVAPAAGFYSTPGKGEQEVRIAYVLNVEDLQKAVKVLEEGLKHYPGRTI